MRLARAWSAWCASLLLLAARALAQSGPAAPAPTPTPATTPSPTPTPSLNERIEGFSLNLLYHTSQAVRANMIVSPITVWTSMATIMEGAAGNTSQELRRVLRVGKHMERVRANFRNISQFLVVNTSTVLLENLNILFADRSHPIEKPYLDVIQSFYRTRAINVNFGDADKTAGLINQLVATATHNRIPSLVRKDDLAEAQMILTNAVYFKGQWTNPFNASQTVKSPFFNDANKKIGEVNMMYNRGVYPYTNMRELQARIIELPYGQEHRLSMLIMLPYTGVSVNEMYHNFLKVPLSEVFRSMVVAATEYEDDEVDCFLPRFKITTDVILNKPLNDMGIIDVFQTSAQLPKMSKNPLYLSRVIHKAEIEVTEEGTVATAVNAAELSNRNSVSKFEANHPFAYLIIEKTTNTIVFAGIYEKPELF